jgi:hypothetical protein
VIPVQSFTQESGPKHVASKLFSETSCASAHKWKSKEQIQSEELAADLAAKEKVASAIKVKEPSERLKKFNASMNHRSVPKSKKVFLILFISLLLFFV